MPILLSLLFALAPQDAGDARWIWGSWADGIERPKGELCAFLREVQLAAPVREAYLTLAVDNAYVLFVNGERVDRHSDWMTARRYDVTELLREGANTVEVTARNQGGPAGLLAFLDVELEGGEVLRVDSDATWQTRRRREGNVGEWAPAQVLAAYGEGPWGRVGFSLPGSSGWTGAAVPLDQRFEAPPGFEVQLAWEGLASYIALETIDATRVLVAAEDGGVNELVDGDGDGAFDDELSFSEAVTYCQGLAWVDGVLYAVGRGPEGAGLYRVRREAPDAPELLGAFTGDTGEHGPHAVVPGPDGALYLAVGNYAGIAAEWSDDSPHRIVYEGNLLEPYLDPRGHAQDIGAPGGLVVRVDLESATWRVLAGGMRNHYDLAFNGGGHLFTFDSDMEWDLGLPWYREVRLLHLVPGGEYGWRSGSGKWPASHADSLPPAGEVGRGSPTGVLHYDGDLFPARYRGAILAGDWSRGRILAFHLEPRGLSYVAEAEELLLGRPLNVSDLVQAPDGSVLIATGGRGGAGSVLRLVFDGERGQAPEPALAEAWPAWGEAEPAALGAALGSDDRFRRYGAAREVERRGLGRADLRLAADDARAAAEFQLTQARRALAGETSGAELDGGSGLLRAIAAGDVETAGIALRALDLSLQAGLPIAPGLGDELLAGYPTGSRDLDRHLALVLGHLAPAGAVEALLDQVDAAPSLADQMHLVYALRSIEAGWDEATTERLIAWVQEARARGGGYSFPGYLRRLTRHFEDRFGSDRFEPVAAAADGVAEAFPAGGEPWSYDSTLAFLTEATDLPRRSPEEGARVFDLTCARCHPFGPDVSAGELGPDLAGVSGRFSRADLLDTIFAPSRVVPEAYRAEEVFLVTGGAVSGLVLADEPDLLLLAKSDGTQVEIDPNDVDERRPSALSTMPEGLLHGLTLEEVADLVHYLEADRPRSPPEEPLWTRLFDGQTLEGWDFDPELWTVSEGVIHGEGEGLPGSSFLISEQSYGDFLLEFDLWLVHGNSGLQFRSTRVRDFGLHGYQADAGETYWGSLYEEGGRGMLHHTAEEVWLPAVDTGGWNHYVVEARGDRLRIEVNGAVTTDLRDGARREGHLGFQLHAGTTRLQLRNLRLREL